MYSKEKGFSYVPPAPPSYHRPMYRQPPRSPMQVPANYSGHAIVDGEERPLGRLEEDSAPLSADLPTPHFEDLPRISHGGEPLHRPTPRTLPSSAEPSRGDLPALRDAPPVLPPSRPHAAPPPLRFPFGHGIGFEELFLLGLILFLLYEGGEGSGGSDLDETVILLGLLLLLG